MLSLLIGLQLKHFIADFLLQKPYQFLNKGKYGHLGGVLHSSIQALGTWLVLCWLSPVTALYVALIDGIIHYHIDWAKVQINDHYGWKANTSEKFWWLLGLDQLLHQLTYIGIAAWV